MDRGKRWISEGKEGENNNHNFELHPRYIIPLKIKPANDICKQLTLGERVFEEEEEGEKLQRPPSF